MAHAQPQAAPPNVAASAAPAAATLGEVTVKAAPTGGAAADAPSEGSRAYTAPGTRAATGLGLTLRDTPQALTVITRQQIDDQAAATVGAALQQSTGVSINPVDRARHSVSVRGFPVKNFQLDGLPASTGNIGLETLDSDMFDRVEVVRGANGFQLNVDNLFDKTYRNTAFWGGQFVYGEPRKVLLSARYTW